jgi:hypothetical protein
MAASVEPTYPMPPEPRARSRRPAPSTGAPLVGDRRPRREATLRPGHGRGERTRRPVGGDVSRPRRYDQAKLIDKVSLARTRFSSAKNVFAGIHRLRFVI